MNNAYMNKLLGQTEAGEIAPPFFVRISIVYDPGKGMLCFGAIISYYSLRHAGETHIGFMVDEISTMFSY